MKRDTSPGKHSSAESPAPLRTRISDVAGSASQRRRASRSLWAACEALLSADDPRALGEALDALSRAFDCDGVALHSVGSSGDLEPWCARGAWQSEPGDLRACLSMPLERAGERVGVLDLQARAGQRWSPTQLGLIRTAAGALGAALGARVELQRLRCLPGRDVITGLPDARALRARLDEELGRTRRHGPPLGLVIVDLDRFAALNARYGRSTGDAVLAETALVLRLALRESDVLARLGTDRFGVLLPEADLGPARRCGERLRRAIEEHRFGRVGRISASFGVAASPSCGLEPLELLDNADRALSVAKKSGRRRVVSAAAGRAH